MTYDANYYNNLKQKQIEKIQRQQQKWIQMSELTAKEYIFLLEIQQEVQDKLKEIEAKENEAKKQAEEPAKTKKTDR